MGELGTTPLVTVTGASEVFEPPRAPQVASENQEYVTDPPAFEVCPESRAVSIVWCPGAMVDAFRAVVMLTPLAFAPGKLPTKTFPIWVTSPMEHIAVTEQLVSAALLEA